MRSSRRREAATRMLNQALKSVRLSRRAELIFEEAPALQLVAIKYCWYLSPYLRSESGNLLHIGLCSAIDAYAKQVGISARERAIAFLDALQATAGALSEMRVSVRTSEEDRWLLWTYDQPLMDWMAENKSAAVQIIPRGRRTALSQVELRLMSHICTMKELRLAGFAISKHPPDVSIEALD